MAVEDRARKLLLMAACSGFGLIYGYPSTLFASTARAADLFPAYASYAFYTVQAVCFIAFALASSEAERLFSRMRPRLIAALGVLGGTLLVFASQGVSPNAGALFLGGTLGAAAGCSVLQVCWMRRYSEMPVRNMAFCVALATLVAALVQSVQAVLGASLLLVALLSASPLLSVLLLQWADRLAASLLDGGDEPTSTWSFPWRPVVLYGSFIFAYKVSLNLLPEASKSASIGAGMLGAAALVFGALALRRERFGAEALCKIALPLIVVGLMCSTETGVVPPALGVAAIAMARSLFSIYIVVALSNLCYRSSMNVFWLFGIVDAIARMASLGANWLTSGPLIGVSHGGQFLLTVALVALVIGAFTAVFSNEGIGVAWGMRRKDGQSPVRVLDEATALQKAARTCNLTLREEEVALLRLQQHTISEISAKLFVSQATVKSHINRIYRKTGTHSVEELRELVDRFVR